MSETAAPAPLPDVRFPHSGNDHHGQGLAKLAVGAIGIVFGDIGTSPIYAFRETFAGHHPLAPDPLHIYGVLSLIFWSMMIVVTIKYVTVIMRADNKGEGGSLALLALISRKVRERRWTGGIVLLGVCRDRGRRRCGPAPPQACGKVAGRLRPEHHILICGYGDLSTSVAQALRRQRRRPESVSVIEADHHRSEIARRLCHRTILGNMADPARLRVAHAGTADTLIVCVGEGPAARVVRAARRIAPSVGIRVAPRDRAERVPVLAAGATDVVVVSSIAGAMLADSVG